MQHPDLICRPCLDAKGRFEFFLHPCKEQDLLAYLIIEIELQLDGQHAPPRNTNFQSCRIYYSKPQADAFPEGGEARQVEGDGMHARTLRAVRHQVVKAQSEGKVLSEPAVVADLCRQLPEPAVPEMLAFHCKPTLPLSEYRPYPLGHHLLDQEVVLELC